MFLKHQDVKQKNWRMRKVKKLFVSSCMLLTVGLGVAVPTGFSQSNGVMVVKADVTQEGSPENVLKIANSLKATTDGTKIGRYSAINTQNLDVSEYKFYYVNSTKLNKNPQQRLWHYEKPKEIYDSTIRVAGDGTANIRFYADGDGSKTPNGFSFAYKFNTTNLKTDHKYKLSFKQTQNNDEEVYTKYLVGKASEGVANYLTSEETSVARNVELFEGNQKTTAERKFAKHQSGEKSLQFISKTDGTASLVLAAGVKNTPKKNTDITFDSFEFIDITEPAQVSSGEAIAGNKNLTVNLSGSDGRKNFSGEIIEVYKNGQLLKKETVTTAGNKVNITLSDDVVLKKDDEITFKVKQGSSGKKNQAAGKIIVQQNPAVVAEQENSKKSLEEVYNKAKKAISDDEWLSDEEKRVQTAAVEKTYNEGQTSINNAETVTEIKDAFKKYSTQGNKISIPDQYKKGEKAIKQEQARKSLKQVHEDTLGKIRSDDWLTEEEKATQTENAKQSYNQGENKINQSDSLKTLNQILKDYTSEEPNKKESIPNKYEKGKKEELKRDAETKLREAQETTKQAIENDPWLSPEQKKAQKENAKARLDAGLKAVEITESLDKLKEVESDFLDKEKNPDSIPNQHKAGTPEVARKTFLDNFEKEAKKEIESIDKDDTLTANAKQVAKDKVAQQLQEATAKVEKAQSFDDLKKVETEFVTALPHTKGEKLNQQQTEAISGLEGVQKATEKAISEDKTLSKDEKKKQIADSKERLKSDTQKVKDAKNADAIKKAFEEGKVNIPQAHIPGDLNKDKEKLLAELKQKADDTEKAIDSDKTLTAKEKEEQKAKTKEELQKATEAVGAIDNREELDKKVPELKKAVEDTHVKGNLEGVKNKAIEDLKKVHDETVAKINGDDTLDKATKEAQVKEADKALEAGKEAITKADDADKVGAAVTEHTPKIKAAHKTGDLKKSQEEANTALDKAAEKERGEINKDATLTTEDKAKQLKEVETALTKAKAKVAEAKTADAINDARDKGVATIDAVHKAGQDLGARKSGQVAKLEEAAKATKDKISADPTLTSKEKEEQSKAVDAELKKAIEAVNAADTADKVDDALGKGVTDIKNQHKTGDPVEARRGLHNKSIDEVAQATKDAITADTTLTEAEKETQRGNVDKEATKAKEELAKAKDADALDKAYGDGVTSIKNQHKSGKGLDVRKDEHKKALEAVAKRVTTEIEADPTLTPEVREQQKAEVQKELELATDKIAEAKDADEADKAYGDGVTAIENAHVIGKGIEARKDLAKKDLAEAVAKTKALIIEDKTLTDDQRKEQLSGVDTEYAKGIENIDAAKDAAGVDKAYSDGVRDILAQYKEGQSLDDRRNAAKEFLLKEADKVTKLINDDPTLTHDQKVDQINKVEQAKLDAIKSVDDAQTADAINDALGKGIENINNQYQHGDGVDVRKATAKGDLEKEAAKVKALIAKDPTLTQADKDKQTAAVDAAKNTAIAAVDKATTADGVNQELGKGITAINKAYRPGEGVKARKEAAKADLEKEAAKVKALIAKDPTLTQADKGKQTAAVDAAKNTAIAAVDKATTAEGINQELGKGITAINKAYRPGEGVKARKEAAKADLEKEAAKVKALITNDPTLTKADKAKQTEAVAKALKAAIAAVDKATTAEGINQELGKGITAINKAYRPGEAVKARKEAAKANLEKVAKETKALISGDRYLSETEKAVQKQAVEQALAKALGQVEAAKTVEAVKLAENLGTVAIRSAYVAGLAKDTDQATAALNEAKQAAIEALKQAAAETLAKITTDAKLTEAQKAEQSENVSLALKTAIATVRSAQSIASVKEAKDKGITAIRAAYVPNKAVAKSSSANHLPKSGDANSIVLVGLGVMSLLLGMVLYSKKKESKD
ncbi:putative extracellular matrix binding protein Epf [Streptococcus pyogenes]|uniref:LPXTG cell wall anchor domain-containing protein n=1 Tax=Streptococcus pyogenes TaxID=1314 RepID=UPI0010E21C73|nr:DUF1542 domain-containing protein [Streptococcus pyogenes]VGW51081.1 putative extracellular matrix binding protein Epf [Streptococcus pyogenes]